MVSSPTKVWGLRGRASFTLVTFISKSATVPLLEFQTKFPKKHRPESFRLVKARLKYHIYASCGLLPDVIVTLCESLWRRQWLDVDVQSTAQGLPNFLETCLWDKIQSGSMSLAAKFCNVDGSLRSRTAFNAGLCFLNSSATLRLVS